MFRTLVTAISLIFPLSLGIYQITSQKVYAKSLLIPISSPKYQDSVLSASEVQIIEQATPNTATNEIAWTQAELDKMTKAVLIMAGKTIQFHHTNGQQITMSGTWQANWGTITTSGEYTAPVFMPPFGVDVITYTNSSGFSETITLRILPNPDLTDSEKTPIKRVSWRSDDQYRPEVFTNAADNIPGIHDPLPANERVVALATDESLPLLDSYMGQQNLPAKIISNQSYNIVPVYGQQLSNSPIIVSNENNVSLALVSLVPQVSQTIAANRAAPIVDPDPCLGCTAGEIKYDEQQPSGPTITGPTAIILGTATRSDQGNINGKIGELLGGAYTITITIAISLVDQQTFYDYSQKRHKYQCRNKKWICIGTEVRKRRDIHHKYSPWWAWILDWVPGRPVGGLKGTYVEKGDYSEWGGA